MLYWAYGVSFVCMEICIGCIGYVCERKLKKHSHKKIRFSPAIQIFGRKTKKNTKKIIILGGCPSQKCQLRKFAKFGWYTVFAGAGRRSVGRQNAPAVAALRTPGRD